MSSFHERKQQRRDHYQRYVKGWRLVTCTACNGSGIYDHNGSPNCAACDGTGVDRVKPDCFTDLSGLIKQVLSYHPEPNTLLRIFIHSPRQISYQYYGRPDSTDNRRVHTKLTFDYDPTLKDVDWCFTDHLGRTHYVHQFEPIKKKGG